MSRPTPVVDQKMFIDRLEAALGASREDGNHAGLLLVDLSNLRTINHRHGYQIGDQLLLETQIQLKALSKLEDNVLRISSKTYAFVIPGLTNPGLIALAINRVQRVLEEALFIDEDVLAVELRFGLAVNHRAAQSALSMLVRAETSLVQSRHGSPLQIEEAIQNVPIPSAGLFLEQRFAEALYDNAFELYFQPKIDLRSGQVFGVEALIRWHLPDHGHIPPDQLVALAYSSGRSYELTRWVFNRALRYQRE